MNTKWPLRISISQLPKKLQIGADINGFVNGYLIFNEKDHKAYFMNDKPIFECSRPVLLSQTHLIIRYHTVVYTGYNKQLKQIGEVCELTFFFNGV